MPSTKASSLLRYFATSRSNSQWISCNKMGNCQGTETCRVFCWPCTLCKNRCLLLPFLETPKLESHNDTTHEATNLCSQLHHLPATHPRILALVPPSVPGFFLKKMNQALSVRNSKLLGSLFCIDSNLSL